MNVKIVINTRGSRLDLEAVGFSISFLYTGKVGYHSDGAVESAWTATAKCGLRNTQDKGKVKTARSKRPQENEKDSVSLAALIVEYSILRS